MAIKVKAVAVGFMGRLIQVGEEFEIDNKKQLGKWMKVIDAPKAAPKAKAPESTSVVS
jgi:hypothetical protein